MLSITRSLERGMASQIATGDQLDSKSWVLTLMNLPLVRLSETRDHAMWRNVPVPIGCEQQP